MDNLDLKLLDLIQVNSRLTADQLSEHVCLSSSACQRRLKRLRKDGVIESEVAIISPAKVGRRLTMIVEVTLERERPDIIDKVKKLMINTPEVQQCYYVTGSVDLIVILTVQDIEDYDHFSKRFFFEDSNIRRFNTLVVTDRIKTGFYVPVKDLVAT